MSGEREGDCVGVAYGRDEQVEAEFDGVWRPGKVSRLTDTGLVIVYYDEPFRYGDQMVTNGWLPPHRVRRPKPTAAPRVDGNETP